MAIGGSRRATERGRPLCSPKTVNSHAFFLCVSIGHAPRRYSVAPACALIPLRVHLVLVFQTAKTGALRRHDATAPKARHRNAISRRRSIHFILAVSLYLNAGRPALARVVRRPSSVVRRPSSVVRRLSSVVRRPSSVVRRPSSVVRRPSSVVRRRPSSVVDYYS